MVMDRKKPSVPSDGRAKETRYGNKRKSMTCPEEGKSGCEHLAAPLALAVDSGRVTGHPEVIDSRVARNRPRASVMAPYAAERDLPQRHGEHRRQKNKSEK
jgi:hypothetical protein